MNMATKKATANRTPAKKAAPVATKPESRKAEPHELILSPTVQGALGMDAWGSKFAGVSELQELVTDLREQSDKVQAGDMSSVEAMLYAQAMTLQTMFTSLARMASTETGLKQYQAKLTFALKAQSQCRSTLEALAEIKNPRPVSFVKQANYAAGAQQVNNGVNADSGPVRAGTHAHTAKSESPQNKLLETSDGNYLDTGAQGAASRVNQTVEAVG
jgi:hypothetical protein